MVMLLLLLYIGIKMATTSIAADKAVYKKMLVDWLAGLVLVYTIHYVMIFIITINEILVDQISLLRTGAQPMAVYEYGLEERAADPLTNDELELTLYDEVKTRAYDLKMTVGTTGMIMYMVLVYYAWKFTFIYLKRYLTVAVLIIMAPLVAVSYAFTKVRSGKSMILTKWLKEFIFIVLLQSIHALTYVIFIQTALGLSLGSIASFILVLMILNFIDKADIIFRKIFGMGGQGGLLDEIAHGAGLKQTIQGATNIAMANQVKKAATAYTKSVAKLAATPAKIGFNAGMKRSAKMKNKKALDYAKKTGNSKIKSYSDYKKHMRNRRTQALEIGTILKQLDSKELNLNEMRENVKKLKIGDSIYDDNGNMIDIVDQDYIDSKNAEIEELSRIENMSKKDKEDWMKEYNKYHTRKGNFKKYRTYMSDKWQDIFDPSIYTEKLVDKNNQVKLDRKGRERYRIIKTQRDGRWHQMLFFHYPKKIDSASMRLSKRLTFKNLISADNDTMKNLEQQAELAKNEIFGFAGLLAGIPMLVADPAAGMVAMSVGISNTSKAISKSGRDLDMMHYKMDYRGNLTFNRFEGSSTQTMSKGARIMAAKQANDIGQSRYEQEASMRNRIKVKHPKLYVALSGNKVTGTIGKLGHTAVLTAGLITVFGAPPVAAVAGAVAGAHYTGKFLTKSKLFDNTWGRYQATVRAARKASGKSYDKALESAGISDNNYMNALADRYLEVEHEEYHQAAKEHIDKFEEAYAWKIAAIREEVDAKTDEELLRDNGYEDPITEEIKPGILGSKPKISGTAERQLIEKALTKYAEQTGTMDVSKINVSDKMQDIETIIKTDLVTRGVMTQADDINKVIENLDAKVQERQAVITKEQRGRDIVEDQIAGEAIVSVMQEKGITDISQLSDEEVLDKFTEVYRNRAKEVPSEDTASVIENMSAQRSEVSAEKPKTRPLTQTVEMDRLAGLVEDAQSSVVEATQPGTTTQGKGSNVQTVEAKGMDSDAMKRKGLEAIQRKKEQFAARAKKPIEVKTVEQLKDTLKKKKKLELDQKILSQEAQLENQSVVEMSVNQNGGLDATIDGASIVQPSETDDVLQMLQLQTELYKDKQKMELVSARRNGGKKDKLAMYTQMSTGEVGGRVDPLADGRQQVDTSRTGTRRVNTARDGSKRVSGGASPAADKKPTVGPGTDVELDIGELLKKHRM